MNGFVLKFAIIVILFSSPFSAQSGQLSVVPDLKVELIKAPREGLVFITLKEPKETHLVSYYVGARALKTRVVPAKIFASLIDSFPKQKFLAGRRVASCHTAVEISGAKTKGSQICSNQSIETFAKWFTETRYKLFE